MKVNWSKSAVLFLALSVMARPIQADNGPLSLAKVARGSSTTSAMQPPIMTPDYMPLPSSTASGTCACEGGVADCDGCVGEGGFFAGADYLAVQPHFSEAIAFVRGTQGVASYETATERIDFGYDSSLRAFFGYRLAGGDSQLKFTYWNVQGDVEVDGTAGAGEFIVDPFGNLVGQVMVIDPADNRFGTVLNGGDRVETFTSVDFNIYDIEFITNVMLRNPAWEMDLFAGVRIADVEEFYESVVTNAGAAFASGDYTADFVGAGPRLGLEARRVFAGRNLLLYLRGHGSLLLGDHQIGSNVTPTPGFTVRVDEHMTRIVPVLESEVGAAWRATDCLTVSSGWLLQSWIDLGASGGTFGGFFTGSDDANIGGFDGWFVRGEVAF